MNEARSMPRSLSLASQTASSLSVLGRPGTFFTSRALTTHTTRPRACQEVVERAPIVRGGLEHDPLDAFLSQPVGKLDDRVGSRRHTPHRGRALARLALMRHPRAHHARVLGHVDPSNPGHDLLVDRVDVDLLVVRLHRSRSFFYVTGNDAGCLEAR